MRHVPTLALVLGAWLVGCAADAEDPAAERGGATSKPSSSAVSGDDEPEAPAFDAQFDPDGGTGVDPTKPTTPATCADKDDPGSTEPLAKALPDTDDCNDKDILRKGILSSASDVDMYKLVGRDKNFCQVETRFATQTRGVQLCVFARCLNSTVDAVTGCESGDPTTSDLGWKGCCSNGPGEATPKWDCSGFTDNDSADFFIRVKPTTANACVDYAFSYVF